MKIRQRTENNLKCFLTHTVPVHANSFKKLLAVGTHNNFLYSGRRKVVVTAAKARRRAEDEIRGGRYAHSGSSAENYNHEVPPPRPIRWRYLV